MNCRVSLIIICSTLLTSFSFCTTAQATDQTATKSQAQKLITSEQFTPINSTEGIPKSIRSWFVQEKSKYDHACDSFDQVMADRGQPFSDTCVQEPGKPGTSFTFGGINKDYCVLCYLQGGFALSSIVAIFRLTNDHAVIAWQGWGDRINYEDAKSLKLYRSFSDR